MLASMPLPHWSATRRKPIRATPYVVADAAALPFPTGTFDLVVAYNSLMDVVDMPSSVKEASRVLELGGKLCISVTHPINDAGVFAGREPDAPFVIGGSYFGRPRFEEKFERDGLHLTFRGWCYPLEDYAVAFEEAGFVIERLREPRPNDVALERFGPSELRWGRVPMFLYLIAKRVR